MIISGPSWLWPAGEQWVTWWDWWLKLPIWSQ
jgi:hypothetical protein